MTTIVQLIMLLTTTLHAQCTVGTNQPPPFVANDGTPIAWARNASVTWGITCGSPCIPISQDLQIGIGTGFTNWSAAASTNNSGVQFTQGSAGDPNATYPWISITMVPDSTITPNAGFTQPVWTQSPPYTIGYAIVAVSDAINVRHYMAFVTGHEIGHTMALQNCTSCGDNTTVMASAPNAPVFNAAADGLEGPSSCDNQQVNQTAYP